MKKKDKTSNKSGKDKIELRPKTTEFRSEASGEIIKSETQSESVLNAQQRMKRASIMRRIAPKLKMLKKNAKNRMATPERLKARAENLARRFVKRRVAGSRGFDYANLGTGEKMSIDRLMIGKHPLVAAIARKLLPKVKQAETRRLSAAHHGKTITVNPMQLAKYTTNATKDLAIGSGRNVSESLSKKSSLSNIPLNIIEEIFHRGIEDSKNQKRLTAEQYAFNRVNSFITGGKAFDIDQDLAEVLKLVRVKLPNGRIILKKVDEKDVVTESSYPKQCSYHDTQYRKHLYAAANSTGATKEAHQHAMEIHKNAADEWHKRSKLKERFSKLANEASKKAYALKEGSDDVVKRTTPFRIAVTYSDPKHPSVSKRKEQIFKRMKVNTTDKDTAKKIAQSHLKNKGFDVHGIDVVEDVQLDEKIQRVAIAHILARKYNAMADKLADKTDADGTMKFHRVARAAKRYGNIASGKKAFEGVMNEGINHIVMFQKDKELKKMAIKASSKSDAEQKAKKLWPTHEKEGYHLPYPSTMTVPKMHPLYHYGKHGSFVNEDVNEMNYRYPPRPNIDRKAQDEIMRKAIEKISNISHTTPKAPTEWEEKHKANRKIGDEIMARIQAKSAAEAQKRINAYRNAERSKRGLPPVSDD